MTAQQRKYVIFGVLAAASLALDQWTKVLAREHLKPLGWGQTRVVIECCSGEHKRFDSNEALGQLVLEHLPPRPRGEVRIEVTFRVDSDCILHARARDADTGARQEVTLSLFGAPVAEELR